ncbi:hypothetical protein C0Q70_11830 [Pomacea canaliculata]|uniref:Uncharacterized protein n=1 Tax=Pomacea canaliculata TaxID=400727 RepID=A0A2T7P763_POMCA|nr:hypothetical protein C0Q70_11830 [Pomacea canaliculata]
MHVRTQHVACTLICHRKIEPILRYERVDILATALSRGQHGRPGIKWLIDKRNGLPQVSPGDNGYQIPEYSPGFHKLGSTRPLARYGKSFRSKNKQHDEEIEEVRQLEKWTPAVPLLMTLPAVEEKK